MPDVNRAQSAMEFLMTYGWAILIMLVVVSVLFYLGILNPRAVAPNSLTFPAGMTAVDFRLDGEGKLYLLLGQATGDEIIVTHVLCSTDEGGDTPQGTVVNVAVPNGESEVVANGIQCMGIQPGTTYYKGKVTIYYTPTTKSFTQKVVGDLAHRIQSGSGSGTYPTNTPSGGATTTPTSGGESPAPTGTLPSCLEAEMPACNGDCGGSGVCMYAPSEPNCVCVYEEPNCIDACGEVITTPGDYTLCNDLMASAGQACITFASGSEGSSLDCFDQALGAGAEQHVIEGPGSSQGSTGIVVNADNIQINECIVMYHGLGLSVNANNLMVTYSTFNENYNGMELNPSGGSASSCSFSNVNSNGNEYYGLGLQGGTNPVSSNSFSECEFDQNGAYGVYFYGENTDSNVFSLCTMRDNTQDGVYIGTGVNGNTFTDNIVTGNGNVDFDCSLPMSAQSESGNTCDTVARCGDPAYAPNDWLESCPGGGGPTSTPTPEYIELACGDTIAAPGQYTIPNGGLSNYDNPAGDGGTCITFESGSDGAVLDCFGETIEGSNKYLSGYDHGIGVYVGAVDGITIRNCDITQFNWGIYTNGATNSHIENCPHIDRNSYQGIILRDQSENNHILNNYIHDNMRDGIVLTDVSINNQVDGNTVCGNNLDGNPSYYDISCPSGSVTSGNSANIYRTENLCTPNLQQTSACP